MKKCDIPKPNFDVGELVAYKTTVSEERGDGVPFLKEVKGAGTIRFLQITKGFDQKWSIQYAVDDFPELKETEMKRIHI